jgi:hypothetical protein
VSEIFGIAMNLSNLKLAPTCPTNWVHFSGGGSGKGTTADFVEIILNPWFGFLEI